MSQEPFADAREISWTDLPPTQPFEGHEPLPGLEELGRHIRDAYGQPSGSPANFEHLRGKTGAEPTNADLVLTIAKLREEFGPQESAS